MKRLVWTLAAIILLFSCNTRQRYDIRGEIDGADGWKVVLVKVSADSDEHLRMDSCIVKKGKFRMRGTVEFPEYCLLYFGDHGPLPLIVENAEIRMIVNLENLLESEITGSQETDLFREYAGRLAIFEQAVAELIDCRMSAVDSEEEEAESQSEKEEEEDHVARLEELRRQLVEDMKRFAAEHPDRIATALMLDRFLTHRVEHEALASYAEGFDAANARSPWVQSVREKADAAARLAVGQPFTDLRMSAPDGTEILLSDYAGNDKYVLIDFWASWCQPCRIANPKTVELYRKYSGKGLEIVGVSLDRDKNEWLAAIESDSLSWPQMSDLMFWQSQAAKLYALNAIPYSILLDKDGAILSKGLPPDDLAEKLATLIE